MCAPKTRWVFDSDHHHNSEWSLTTTFYWRCAQSYEIQSVTDRCCMLLMKLYPRYHSFSQLRYQSVVHLYLFRQFTGYMVIDTTTRRRWTRREVTINDGQYLWRYCWQREPRSYSMQDRDLSGKRSNYHQLTIQPAFESGTRLLPSFIADTTVTHH
jgi:hypothetical protein